MVNYLTREPRTLNEEKILGKWCRESWIFTCKRMKLHLHLTPLTKVNSKWIKDSDIRSETISLIEENIGKKAP